MTPAEITPDFGRLRQVVETFMAARLDVPPAACASPGAPRSGVGPTAPSNVGWAEGRRITAPRRRCAR